MREIAHCKKKEEVFLTVLRYNVRERHLQYLMKLKSDLFADEDKARYNHVEKPYHFLEAGSLPLLRYH